MIISYISFVTLLTVVYLADADLPGARIIITQNGLNYGVKQALPYLKNSLNEISIPSISGEKLSCHYELNNFKIGNIELPELSVSTGTSGLTINAQGVSLKGGVDYSYKCVLGIHGSGNVDLGVSDSSLSLSILVDKDDTGHPILMPNKCSLELSQISIDFHGSLSGLANDFRGTIEDKLKSYANDNACSKISDLINTEGNSFLQDFNTVMPIDNLLLVDYSLVNNPVFTSADLEVDIKGEFFSTNPEADKPPFTPSPIPQVSEATKMAYLVASPYLANTAAFAIQEEGYLKYNITPDTLPVDGRSLFTTVLFEDIIPDFYKKYPHMNITVNIYATKPPILKASTEGATLEGSGMIEVGVYDANCDNAIVHAFSLEVEGSTKVEIGLVQVDSKTNVTGKVDTLDWKISVKDTEVGAINTSSITEFVDSLSNLVIIPLANRYASVGWPIPTILGVELENSEVTLGNGYILIGTDIIYEPQLPVLMAVAQNQVSQSQEQTSRKSRVVKTRVQF